MKKIFFTITLIISAMMALSSCSNIFESSDNYSALFYNALVTVKHTDGGTLYFQLDDKTTLKPYGYSDTALGDQQFRALINYTDRDEAPTPAPDGFKFDKLVNVYRIDKVLTKSLVTSQGEKDSELYGSAPIEMVGSWATIVEDGYITIVFSGYWGDVNKVHTINLVSGVDSDDPYLLELRHDTGDDNTMYDPQRYNGIVAFDLNSLPDTQGETVKLKIRFISFSGEKTVSFDYCTGKTSLPDSQAPGIDISQSPEVN